MGRAAAAGVDEALKAAFLDGYLRATVTSDVDVEVQRARLKALERAVEEVRAVLIEAAVKSGLLSAEQAVEMNQQHQARLIEVDRQLDDLKRQFMRPPLRTM